MGVVSMSNEFVACPACNAEAASRCTPWWARILGGALMARGMSLVKCGSCGAVYGGKNGKDWTKKGPLYFVAYPAVGLGAVFTIIRIVDMPD